MAVSGEELRESGLAVRNIFDVLVGCVTRYYLMKEDAEDELETVSGEIEALKSKNANLREENGELRRRVAGDPLVKRGGTTMVSVVAGICVCRFQLVWRVVDAVRFPVG